MHFLCNSHWSASVSGAFHVFGPPFANFRSTRLQLLKRMNLLSSMKIKSLFQVELRCAGGWVRDKLLGHDSKDIDIALDTMLGEDFGKLLLPILEVPRKSRQPPCQ